MFKIKNYDQIMKLFWPIALTMLLTNTLAFVDSAMIANYDILGVGAISLASQIQFLFGPVYFAILMGVGIYTVQYYSAEKYDSLKKLAGMALVMLLTLDIINFLVLTFLGTSLINLMAPQDDSAYKVVDLSVQYIKYYKYSLLLAPIDMFFVYQYRAMKKPKISLVLGTSQALLNIFFNMLLIYGLFGLPELGVVGAAIGTLFSRIIIISIYIIYSIKIKAPFLGTPKEMLSFKKAEFLEVIKSTIPLMIVEFGFGLGNLLYLKIYALSSTQGYTAYSVAKTISFIINALVMGTANTAGIMAGTFIATKDSVQKVKESMRDVFKFVILNSFLILLIAFFILPLFIPFFTKNEQYYDIIKQLLIINGIWMSLRVFSSSFIAILKSGNDNRYVLLIDAGVTYIVGIPLTFIVYLLFSPSIVVLRSMIIIEFIVKIILGYNRYKKEKWIKKL